MPGRISPQAQMLLDGVKDLGVPRKEVTVRTDTEKDAEGYIQYGHAHLHTRTPRARDAVVENAQHLADRGLDVNVFRYSCGHPLMVTLGSEYNPRKKVTTYDHKSLCPDCR
jgi:hypothetical protein